MDWLYLLCWTLHLLLEYFRQFFSFWPVYQPISRCNSSPTSPWTKASSITMYIRYIVLLLIVQVWRNWAFFCKSWCAQISLKLPWSWSRAEKKTLHVRPIQDTCRALHRLVESVKRERYLGIYDVKSFFLLWISSMEV